VQQDLPGVGENLQDHLNARFVQKLARGDTLNTRFNNPVLKAWMGVQYALARRGPMTSGSPPLAGFFKSDPSLETPDLQFLAGTVSYEKLGAKPHPFPAISGGICNMRPRSRGYVRIADADPASHPRIVHNYLMDSEDQRIAVKSLRMMRDIFKAPALRAYSPQDLMPGAAVESDDELLDYIRHTGSTAFHPVGTCRMGNDPMAVVDARLRVHGVDALRIVDASVMPTLVSGNTNAATIMIAEKASDMIKGDRRAAGARAA
jgi:choline dehydrogenase